MKTKNETGDTGQQMTPDEIEDERLLVRAQWILDNCKLSGADRGILESLIQEGFWPDMPSGTDMFHVSAEQRSDLETIALQHGVTL